MPPVYAPEEPSVSIRSLAVPSFALVALALAGCRSTGELTAEGGIGVSVVRSACPQVSVPAGTGDITLFDPATSQDASAIDVTGVLTNVRSTCNDSGADIVTAVTFSILGSRTNAAAARDVVLPYFITVVQGGSAVIAKRVGRVQLHFDAGQTRASVNGQASATVNRAAATLPDDVRARLTERRRAGQQDAAIDPLSQPEIRSAVARATFEAVVGFQLTQDQLRYNATR